jgi:hypothetical protein
MVDSEMCRYQCALGDSGGQARRGNLHNTFAVGNSKTTHPLQKRRSVRPRDEIPGFLSFSRINGKLGY